MNGEKPSYNKRFFKNQCVEGRLHRIWVKGRLLFLLGMGGLVALAWIWGFGMGPFRSADGDSEDQAQVLRVDMKSLDGGKSQHFSHFLADGTKVRFFLLKTSDGVVRGAFDACEVCWPEGKGYYQEGRYMVCRNCGRRFEERKIGQVRGGCNPHPLRFSIVGKQVVIRKEDLEEGASYFKISVGGTRP